MSRRYTSWVILAIASLGMQVPFVAVAQDGVKRVQTTSDRDRAAEFFAQGNYTKALDLYLRVVKSSPDDLVATVGAARSYYHLEQWDEAQDWFARTKGAQLETEATYEQAHTYMHFKKYPEALEHFKRIPKGHALYDLANYFGGICAVKLKRYGEAQTLMENAVTLPEKYQKSRAVYEKHIAILAAQRQDKRLGQIPSENASATKPAVVAAAPEPYQHYGVGYIEKFAIMGLEKKTEHTDFSGLKKQDAKFEKRYFWFKSGLIQPLKDTGERRPVVGMELSLWAEQQDFDGIELGKDRDTIPAVRLGEFSKTGSGEFKAFSEVPVGEKYWIGMQLNSEQEYPDFGANLATNRKMASVFFGQAQPGYKAEVHVGAAQTLFEGTRANAETIFGTYIEKRPFDFMKVTFYADHYELKYYGLGPGPQERVKATLEVKNYLPYGFTLIPAVKYQSNKNYLLYDLAGEANFIFDEESVKPILTLLWSPWDWIEFSVERAEEKRQLAAFSSPRPEVVAALKNMRYSSLQSTTMGVGINLWL